MKIRTIPNYLTIFRMFLTPVFILLYQYVGAFFSLLAFSVAAITDMLDGKIARKTGMITDFGKFMDPLADKLLVGAALIAFLSLGPKLITTWMVLIIMIREVTITILRTIAARKGNVIAATRLGKYKASSQMYSIVIALLLLSIHDLRNRFFADRWHFLTKIHDHNGPIYYLMFIPVVLTLISGLEFIYINRKVIKEIVV
ncbi:CDP-diacylglycerol--glycerol-3-phosphate 3-phosphatidyltransferase [Candidatus Poribacteria bacterium]|nr:CDP-diacylglycerol--glycerol-3-phosphate 3-phosphatidyltransferase [Candidatus Poribacteria bacterium]